MKKILIIDDEPGIRTVLKDIVTDEGYDVALAGDGFEGLKILREEIINLVILDVWLPNMGGMDVLKIIKDEHPGIEVIIISGHANIDLAVKSVKLGAYDFLEKPLSLDKMVNLINNALTLESLKSENKNLKESLFMEDEMIGKSPELDAIRERIRQSAASDAKVLITGSNGTGKELVAREIHRKSDRANNVFVEVNCAAIPDTLIESELFGHEKGSFTGAVARRKGKFELAHKGTLFLDEVADMSLSAQAKVLRVIQEMTFERIGGEQTIQVDVRLIAATNKDILQEIKDGKFREDLYFRLNVVPVHVPRLSERAVDLPLLIDYFMGKFVPPGEVNSRKISPEGMALLTAYGWPGNIRELKNFVERINIMSDEEVISRETVEYFLGDNTPDVTEEEKNLNIYDSMKLSEARDAFELELLSRRLERFEYNISRTAQDLGIYPSNLHGKIKKFGIETRK
ncbi:MAG: sigma-54-dependent Fis family transcriptional regulator [Spirochaetales bacterium]|nr:sigma-54-dependent Fis family transcriptional regulator [Spirochaetales bacterium]